MKNHNGRVIACGFVFTVVFLPVASKVYGTYAVLLHKKAETSKGGNKTENEKTKITAAAVDLCFKSVDGFICAFYREFGMCPRESGGERGYIELRAVQHK